jgi:hypothetical protein
MIEYKQTVIGWYVSFKDKYNRTWYWDGNTWKLSNPKYYPDKEFIPKSFDETRADDYQKWFDNHKGSCSNKCTCVTNPFK